MVTAVVTIIKTICSIVLLIMSIDAFTESIFIDPVFHKYSIDEVQLFVGVLLLVFAIIIL